MARRILRVDGATTTTSVETAFDSEAQLHAAIAAHPEVLPTEDLRMGSLVSIANELDLGAGPLDLLAVDAVGRLVVIEFKRGSENPDVRKVVAQVLDYGSVLWHRSYEDLEERCRVSQPGFAGALADNVRQRFEALGETCDAEVFQTGVETSLETGNFVFLYVGRNLDERTRRIMTFLADGARLTFFAVEVDHYRDASNASVMVPRTAFVPSWVSGPNVSRIRRVGSASFEPLDVLLEKAPEGFREAIKLLDQYAGDLDLTRALGSRSVQYLANGIVAVYAFPTFGRIEVQFDRLEGAGVVTAPLREMLRPLLAADGSAMRVAIPPNDLVTRWLTDYYEFFVALIAAVNAIESGNSEASTLPGG